MPRRLFVIGTDTHAGKTFIYLVLVYGVLFVFRLIERRITGHFQQADSMAPHTV